MEIVTTLAPWLSVADTTQAIEYYKNAFGATASDYLKDEAGRVIVACMSIDKAKFWVQQNDANPRSLNKKSSVRMILTTSQPDKLFNQAVSAGASVIADMHEEHGWYVGRIHDPFGHQWEIGHPSP